MPANPLLRRLMTVPAVLVGFVAVTLTLPALLLLALGVDLFRFVVRRRPFVMTRGVLFLWVYLAGEVWALVALLFTAILPTETKTRATVALQKVWAGWSLTAVLKLFNLDLEIEGDENVPPGPILVLARHASLIDTLLPAQLITRPTGIRLRYVLKKELMADPALDIAGHRLPNAFIDRSSTSERNAIRNLAHNLGKEDGVLIYPEGTRFTEAKRLRYLSALETRTDQATSIARSFRHVLPPRPGGTLALLDSSEADVVILAHHGLEPLSSVQDVWDGQLVGGRISVAMWRIDRDHIPTDRSERVVWLFERWRDIDEWLDHKAEEVRR